MRIWEPGKKRVGKECKTFSGTEFLVLSLRAMFNLNEGKSFLLQLFLTWNCVRLWSTGHSQYHQNKLGHKGIIFCLECQRFWIKSDSGVKCSEMGQKMPCSMDVVVPGGRYQKREEVRRDMTCTQGIWKNSNSNP